MEEVIDLRPYLQKLIQHAKWIIGAALILATVTFFIIRSLPETYQATALVIVLGQSDTFQFDPRIQSTNNNEPINALPELATNNNLLLELLQDDALATAEIDTLDDLQKLLQAGTGGDRSLIQLTVNNPDKELAAHIANRWADLFITQTNTVYGTQNSGQVTFFQEQLAQAETELETAETSLIEFQEINRTAVISNTLTFYNEEQALQLTTQQSLVRLLQDSEQLRSQLLDQSNNSPVTFSDQLTALNLQMEAYNADTNQPIFIQIDSEATLIGATKNEQIAFLDRLIALLNNKLTTVENRLDTLEPEILTLQQAWQEAVVENNRLTRNRMIAEETYISLARKVQEEQITAQDMTTGLRLVSPAVVPDKPAGRQTLFFTALAGAAGFILSALFILIKGWWQQTEEI